MFFVAVLGHEPVFLLRQLIHLHLAAATGLRGAASAFNLAMVSSSPQEKPALSRDQGWALWDALAKPEHLRYRAAFGVLLFTSIRTGEMLGLQWQDLDFGIRTIHVRRQIYRNQVTTPKTNNGLRDRRMSEELYKALLHHRQMSQYTSPGDFVFTTSTGRPANPDDLRKILQHLLRDELGIRLPKGCDGLHLLRHTSGSWVYESAGPKEAQAALGYSNIQTTLGIYTHLAEGAEDTVTDAVFSRPLAPTLAPEHVN